jgi:hypothetical protein
MRRETAILSVAAVVLMAAGAVRLRVGGRRTHRVRGGNDEDDSDRRVTNHGCAPTAATKYVPKCHLGCG